MTGETERIKDKIRDLLSLAGDATDHEGKTALRMARALMLKSGITEEELEDSMKDGNLFSTVLLSRHSYPVYIKVAITVASSFADVYPIINRQRKTVDIYSYSESDLEFTVKVFNTMIDVMEYNAKKYVDEHYPTKRFSTSDRRHVRDSYRLGFLDGVKEMIQEQNKSEDFKEYALIRTNQLERVKNDVHKDISVKSVTHRGISINPKAFSDGEEKGRKTDVTRSSIE